MKTVVIEIKPSNIKLKVKLANTFLLRLRGLIGYSSPFPILISPCRQIHTWLMKFPIDIVYLDKNFKCLQLSCNVPTGKISPAVKGSFYVLELPAGFISENHVDKKSKFYPVF